MSVELDFIKDMFDSIAPKYDFLNRFLSAGQDIIWRREMVVSADIPQDSRVLDVACGTCDVALEVKRQKGNTVTIFGTDFSPGMLALGKNKIMKKIKDKSNGLKADNHSIHKNSNIHLVAGNALALAFRDEIFDAVFIAFGIRNIMDREGAILEFHRTLKTGGTLAILELTSPPEGFFRDIYLLYFKRLLPAIGAIFSKNSSAYSYLPASVLNFPTPEQFAATIRESGFKSVKCKGMTFGIVTLFIGKKSSLLQK
ncbi:MAG: bifunctional demethylmenaquinone methyltransferase/2-methoxy-6-polyprenyl-1,4-benzoquinol methylase UbiE [Desulfamplus sp.]|nr:bifunctional demethylmenaquinone methyltransferase/2-methoxy-6-polyprenyl-1,4-benzoquinol methylase UbiE [Desulfamplus sp.]